MILKISSGFILSTLLIYLSFKDIKDMELPEPICRLGLLLGISVVCLENLFLDFQNVAGLLISHLLAASIALISLEIISNLTKRFTGIYALGLGDAKLASMGGAWIGIEGISIALALAFMAGGLFALIGRLTGQLKPLQAFPFGPFLASAIWIIWICGPNWWSTTSKYILGI